MKKPNITTEIGKMKTEKWLPVETQLVVWSLVLGAALLAILVWLSYRFFPAA